MTTFTIERLVASVAQDIDAANGRAIFKASPSPLAALARDCQQTVEDMTGTELDNWYNVRHGYRPAAADPALGPQRHAGMVAARMFLDRCDAQKIPAVDAVERRRLCAALLTGVDL